MHYYRRRLLTKFHSGFGVVPERRIGFIFLTYVVCIVRALSQFIFLFS